MFIVGLLSWWYGAGWMQRLTLVCERLIATADYFSIDLLLKTLFAPFRQISAGQVDGPIGVRWRAFVDRLVSRFIGAIVRLFMILFGSVTLIIFAIIGGASVVFWGLIPLLPLIGVVMTAIGWAPSWM